MLIFLFVIVGFLFFPVMFGLGVDSWRERAISEVRGLRDERGPTQLEIYTRTSLLDSRAKHGNDRGEEKNTGMTRKE